MDGTTGKKVKTASVIIDTSGNVSNARCVAFQHATGSTVSDKSVYVDVFNQTLCYVRSGVEYQIAGPSVMGGTFYKKFTGNTSQTLYEDNDVKFHWDAVNYQPKFYNKTFSGWWDASITIYSGRYPSSSIKTNHDDISPTFQTDYYFTTNGTLDTGFNFPAYASRMECHLMSEGQISAPVFKLTFLSGNPTSSAIAIIERYP